MRFYFALAVLGSIPVTILPAVADDHAALIKQWEKQEALCRGENSEKVIEVACDRREALSSKLFKMGWCFGDSDRQYAYQYRWHLCKNRPKSTIEHSDVVSNPVAEPSNNNKKYSEILKGTWGETDKTCKGAKEVEAEVFYNGAKFVAYEQDCIVMNTSEKANVVTLKMLCVFDAGEKSKVTQKITFVNDSTITTDNGKYRKCAN